MNKIEKGAIVIVTLLILAIGFKFYAESLIPSSSEIYIGYRYQDFTTLANSLLILISSVIIIGSIISFFVLLKKKP